MYIYDLFDISDRNEFYNGPHRARNRAAAERNGWDARPKRVRRAAYGLDVEEVAHGGSGGSGSKTIRRQQPVTAVVVCNVSVDVGADSRRCMGPFARPVRFRSRQTVFHVRLAVDV